MKMVFSYQTIRESCHRHLLLATEYFIQLAVYNGQGLSSSPVSLGRPVLSRIPDSVARSYMEYFKVLLPWIGCYKGYVGYPPHLVKFP